MLKIKFAARLICTAALALLTLFCVTTLLNAPVFKVGKTYRFYVGDTSKNCKEVVYDAAVAPLKKTFLREINGESTTYDSLDLQAFLTSVHGKIVFTEELSDSVNYYCTANLPYSVTLYGREINLHVCVKESGVTVASPIIFGGY